MSHREQHPAADRPHQDKAAEVSSARTEHNAPADGHERHAGAVHDNAVHDSAPDIGRSDTLPVGAFQGRPQGTDDMHEFDGGGDPDFTAGSGVQEVESLSHPVRGSGNDAVLDFVDGNAVGLVGVNAGHLSDSGLDWS